MDITEAGTILATGIGAGKNNAQCLVDGQPLRDATGQFGAGESINGHSWKGDGQPVINDPGQLGEGGSIIGQNIGSSGDQHGSGRFTGQKDNGSGKATDGRDLGKFKGKQSFASLFKDNQASTGSGATGRGFGRNSIEQQAYASLFKDNRAPREQSKLHFVAPPLLGDLELTREDIDTVEKSFGFCLVGYVMGPRPSPYTVKNFIKGWGESVKFKFKENGWICFQFPNEVSRDAVLNGGPYMIFGKQLFLKKLPSCFLFSKEDMEFIPAWVQIFGLPADCWTTNALSKIASIVGRPIQTDSLTITKRASNYARVLVEMDAKQTRILDHTIRFPSGKKTKISFVYEFEAKYCVKCKSLGHSLVECGVEHAKGIRRPPFGQCNGKQTNAEVDCPDASGLVFDSSASALGKDKGEVCDHSSQLHSSLGDACLPDPEVALPDVGLDAGVPGIHGFDAGPRGADAGLDMGLDSGQTSQLHLPSGDAFIPVPDVDLPDGGLDKNLLGNEEGNPIEDNESEDIEYEDADSDDLLDMLTRAVTKDKEEWMTVKGRNKNKHKNKIAPKERERKYGYNMGMGKISKGRVESGSAGTDITPPGVHMPFKKQQRFVGKERMDEVRPPDTASG